MRYKHSHTFPRDTCNTNTVQLVSMAHASASSSTDHSMYITRLHPIWKVGQILFQWNPTDQEWILVTRDSKLLSEKEEAFYMDRWEPCELGIEEIIPRDDPQMLAWVFACEVTDCDEFVDTTTLYGRKYNVHDREKAQTILETMPTLKHGTLRVMYHGTTRDAWNSIRNDGFRESGVGMLGKGVYMCNAIRAGRRYAARDPSYKHRLSIEGMLLRCVAYISLSMPIAVKTADTTQTYEFPYEKSDAKCPCDVCKFDRTNRPIVSDHKTLWSVDSSGAVALPCPVTFDVPDGKMITRTPEWIFPSHRVFVQDAIAVIDTDEHYNSQATTIQWCNDVLFA